MVTQINSDRKYAKGLFISLCTGFYSAVHRVRSSLCLKKKKKKMCVSGFYPNPGRFVVKCEQNVVKCAERVGAGMYIENAI